MTPIEIKETASDAQKQIEACTLEMKLALTEIAGTFGVRVSKIIADFEAGLLVTEIEPQKPLNDPAFLAEMQQPVPLASEQVGTPEIPDLKEETEPTEPPKRLVEAGTEDWKKAVVYIVLPDKKGNFGTVAMLETKVRFNPKDKKCLEDYEWYRTELLADNMSLLMVKSQNVEGTDFEVFEQLDKVRRAQKVTA